ncbi:hypothetical protein DPMN_096704 [Dreissena polymorpha]|uniref:RWD domain-containing protein n=2 Tax=Dreissena polymorpha TaxID=45954 RepID=A0A9D4L8W1_DREPO|nr:hypothetical protein DPMN_096704 [Dreissena polymorpha]
MASESYKERQDDELQALHAIFMSDFKDLRQKDAWKVNRPPHVSLTLKPQESFGHHGQETYVQLDLIFKCPPTYPDV